MVCFSSFSSSSFRQSFQQLSGRRSANLTLPDYGRVARDSGTIRDPYLPVWLYKTAKCRDAFKAWASELPQLRVPAFGVVRKRSLAAGAVETMKRVRLLQAFHEIKVGQNTVIAIQAGLAVRRDKDGTNAAYAC